MKWSIRVGLALVVLVADAEQTALAQPPSETEPSAANATIAALPPPTASADLRLIPEEAPPPLPSDYPWDISVSFGIPAGLSGRIARTFADTVRAGIELGTMGIISTAGASLDIRLFDSDRLAIHGGTRAVGVVVCAAHGCFGFGGGGPRITAELGFGPRMYIGANAGALYGRWNSSDESNRYRWFPQVDVRTGYRF